MKTYPAVLSTLSGAAWAIEPQKLRAIMGVVERHVIGTEVNAAALETLAADSRARAKPQVSRSVAVLPLVGTIVNRGDMLTESSGAVSVDRWGRDFAALVADESIGAIVIDADSPGGMMDGLPEVAEQIYQARGVKPIVALANTWMASGAYWLGSAADEIVVTPSGWVGSIGVIVTHVDYSAANAEQGIKVTYITYGQYKAELNPDEPLSDESVAELQRQINIAGDWFNKTVARNRNTTPAAVRENYGQGRMYRAQEAVQRGMADRVATLDETIARLASGKAPKRSRTAALRRRLNLEN